MSLGAKIQGLVSGLLEDENKLDHIIAKGFKHFDTDGSNFIEAHEIERAVQKVLSVAHLPMVPPSILDGVFMKVAGADGKVDKAEFVRLFRTLLAKIKGHPEPVAEAALEQGYVAPE